ncbi:hypothetical protein Nepgr_025370 [Nepenthes gracilis]|uniref:tryptophan--tRNA ligase n=1 Tax=Nepenthes gracilis TaxID=150966 RepID=A0AAD3T6B2_NEPGR|nr:hypothetical protein Nepgr_025370 [Nepenthes gracilis]
MRPEARIPPELQTDYNIRSYFSHHQVIKAAALVLTRRAPHPRNRRSYSNPHPYSDQGTAEKTGSMPQQKQRPAQHLNKTGQQISNIAASDGSANKAFNRVSNEVDQFGYKVLFFDWDNFGTTKETRKLESNKGCSSPFYLACGIDPSKTSVCVQFHVCAHEELLGLLSSATPVGWLNRMIQFKEKSRKVGDKNVRVTTLLSLVLMASDVLIYQFDFVPVGEDLKQPLELTREVDEHDCYLYGGRKWMKMGGKGGTICKRPAPLIPPAEVQVMLLSTGLSKISKSTLSDQSRNNLRDPKEAIATQLVSGKTKDATQGTASEPYQNQQNQQLVTNGTSNSVQFRSASERVEQRRADCFESFRRLQQHQQFSTQHCITQPHMGSVTSAITSISRRQVSSSSNQSKAPSPEATLHSKTEIISSQ